MTGREALRALADGKRLRWSEWNGDDGYIEWSDERGIVWHDGKRYDLELSGQHWQIVEPRATDEELAAEMERLGAEPSHGRRDSAFLYCARMLRERKVKP